MSMYQGHSHSGTPKEDAAHTTLAPRQQEFMLAGWHVRPAHHRITDGRQPRQLEPRLMTLLCLLAARPGAVLSRNDLMESLWPRVVVNENSLTRAVSDLRRQLQDDSGTTFIETVPKKGYMLVAPVSDRVVDTTAVRQPSVGADRSARTEQSRPGAVAQWLRHRATSLAAFNIALAIALIGSFNPLLSPSGGNTGTDTPPVAQLLRNAGGSEPEVSEKTLRDELMRHDDAQSYAPTMTTARMSSPANTEATAGPAASPDGELVAFTRRTDKGSTLLIGSMLDSSDPLQVYSSQHRIDHLHWSPVGTALLFSVLPTVSHAALGEQEEGRLMLFDLQDLSVRELYRSGRDPDDTPARFNDALNIT